MVTWDGLPAIATGPLFRSINRHGQIQPGRLAGIDVAHVVKKLPGLVHDGALCRPSNGRAGRMPGP